MFNVENALLICGVLLGGNLCAFVKIDVEI